MVVEVVATVAVTVVVATVVVIVVVTVVVISIPGLQFLEVLLVIDVLDLRYASLVDVVELICSAKTPSFFLLFALSSDHLVEDVKVPFPLLLVDDSYVLQEVGSHHTSTEGAFLVKGQVDELAEAATVVVPDGSGVADGLKDGVRLPNFFHDACFVLVTVGFRSGETFSFVFSILGVFGKCLWYVVFLRCFG